MTLVLAASLVFGTAEVSAFSFHRDNTMKASVERTEMTLDYYLEDELLDMALYSETDEQDYAELEALAYELSDDEMDDIAYDVEAYEAQESLAYELTDDEMDDIAYDVEAYEAQETIASELTDDQMDDIAYDVESYEAQESIEIVEESEFSEIETIVLGLLEIEEV